MYITPDLETFTAHYMAGTPQLAYVTLPADLETPVSAMLKLQDGSKHHFLFESVQDGQRRDRYSIIGMEPDLIYKCVRDKAFINRTPMQKPDGFVPCEKDPLTALQELIDESRMDIPEHLPPMASGLFGYLTYDMVKLMERLPDSNPDTIGIPDSIFIRPRIMVIFDAVKDTVMIITSVRPEKGRNAEFAYLDVQERIANIVRKLSTPLKTHDYSKEFATPTPLEFASNTTRDQYHTVVKIAKEYIAAGDIFQVVPSQRFTCEFTLPPFALYRSLRHLNPSPYLFYVHFSDFTLVGSSPEILARLKDDTVTVRPIAGTRKRGTNKIEDEALAKDLLSDEKELAEHLMLVDLGRNDVGRIAQIGTVKVEEQFVIEYYSHVMHIVSHVTGKIRPDCTAIDALKAGFPVGTVSGAPKIRAMEIIDELETERRSFYAGGVGYFSANGSMDICIALRTGLVKDDKLYLQAGGGVVADSDPEAEYQETVNKSKALVRAAENAVRFV